MMLMTKDGQSIVNEFVRSLEKLFKNGELIFENGGSYFIVMLLANEELISNEPQPEIRSLL